MLLKMMGENYGLSVKCLGPSMPESVAHAAATKLLLSRSHKSTGFSRKCLFHRNTENLSTVRSRPALQKPESLLILTHLCLGLGSPFPQPQSHGQPPGAVIGTRMCHKAGCALLGAGSCLCKLDQTLLVL